MYARLSVVAADPTRVDALVEHVRNEVLPAVRDLDGSLGLSVLVDRDGGRYLTVAVWRDEAAMQASADATASLRRRAAEAIQATGTPEVTGWEYAVRHLTREAPDGACTRVSWLRVAPDRMTKMVDYYREHSLPVFEALDGFCSANLLVDRPSGRALSAVTFADRAALVASRERTALARARAGEDTGMEVLEVAEFDLVLSQLRVPETA